MPLSLRSLIVYTILYNDIIVKTDISNSSHIVMRFIGSHIVSAANARAICWELHFDNVLASHFVVHSHFLMYHHLLGHQEIGIAYV